MNKQKVIVIDDDHAILEVMRMALEGHGFKVSTCNDSSIVSSLNSINTSVILLDLSLEREDGRDVLKKIKSQSDKKSIPVIIISAHHLVRKSVFESGADDFLPKPFDIKELISTVEKHTRLEKNGKVS